MKVAAILYKSYFRPCPAAIRNEPKSPVAVRDLEPGLFPHDYDKQSLQATVQQLEKDKQQLLADLRMMTERLAKGKS